MLTLYNVVSADGYIARIDRSEDFIPDDMWPRFLDICLEYGTVIMGRKTYDAIQRYDASLRNSFDELPVKKIVVSRDENFKPKDGYVIARSPKEACSTAGDALISSGPTLNTAALKEGLIGKMILEKLPVKISEGLKVFEEGAEPTLELVSKEENNDGRTKSIYTVKPISQTS